MVTTDTQSAVQRAPGGWARKGAGGDRAQDLHTLPQCGACREGADLAGARTCFLLAPDCRRSSSWHRPT